MYEFSSTNDSERINQIFKELKTSNKPNIKGI